MTSSRRGSRAQRLARRRQRSRRRVFGATFATTVAAVALVVIMSTAIAYWRASGSGTGAGAATGLAAPSNVAGSASGTTMHVTWTGVTPPGAGSFGYYVQRFTSADGFTAPSIPAGTCSSSAVALLPVSPTSCDDAALAAGTYEYRLVAVFRSWTATSALSGAVTIFALDHFTVSTSASTTAGASLTVTVTARNASNTTITNYSGTIQFTSSDGAATLPANYTFLPGDSGVHTFTSAAVLKTVGSQSVAVNDVAQPTKTGTATVNVTAAPVDHFVVTAPSTAASGAAFTTATVAAKDAFGNVAAGWTSATKCVTFSGPANAPDGTTPTYPAPGACPAGQSPLTFSGSGVASGFSVTLFDAQTTTLTVSSGTAAGTSSNITVSAGSAAALTFTNASNRNGAVNVTCTGPIATLTCTPASQNGPGNGRLFVANVALVDAHQNFAVNTTNGTIAITLAPTPSNLTLSPLSASIPAGQTTSTASFELDLKNGSSSGAVTASATVAATAVTAQLTSS